MMMILCFTALSTVFKSYYHDEGMILKGSVQYDAPYSHKLTSTSSGIWNQDFMIQRQGC